MRADESKLKRETDLLKLETWLRRCEHGEIKIEHWYEAMARLGLQHSDRQRLSDLRSQRGLLMDFDRSKKAYVYRGWQESGQLSLLEIGGRQ